MLKSQLNLLQTESPPVRWAMGLITALAAFGIALLLPPSHRALYLIAYPGVVLSAWLFGVGAGVTCAIASGTIIELFAHYSHLVVVHRSIPSGSPSRLIVFVIGSVTVTWLTQQVSNLRQQNATEELRRQLELGAAEQRLAEERQRADMALHERETRLQMALRAGQIGLWDRDLETGALLWSDEHYRILGLEPGSVPPSYEVMHNAIHPEDRDAMDARYKSTLAEGKPLYSEYRVLRPDGTVAWVEAEGQYELDAAGKPVRMLGVLTDVTRRKQAEAALLQSEKLAIAGRLAATVAHEINNPLAAVANLMYLIRHADSLEGAREHADTALKQVMRVAHITRQTLKFHKQNEASRITRLSEETESVLSLFHGKLRQSGVTVERRYEDDPVVECPSGDLRQVFANLIVNALDAMPRGGRLTIRIRRSVNWRERTEYGLRITIADTGEGMAPEAKRRIYEPFFTTKGSTGLGMWVTAQIVDRLRGSISVWSSRLPDHSGTVFSVFLPFDRSSNGVSVLGGEQEPEALPVS
ncbi:MAG: PAS domain-containing protein [Silvibacterium sp.]|nr:PAS domain-containing protein [Silvibacterium sp.]